MNKEQILKALDTVGAESTNWQDGDEAEITFYGGINQLTKFAELLVPDGYVVVPKRYYEACGEEAPKGETK